MIKVSKKENKLDYIPENLVPTIFRCSECGCTIRRLESTNSFILVSISPAVESGKKKICPYCYKLQQYRGVCG